MQLFKVLRLVPPRSSQSVSQSPLVSRCSAGGEDRAALVATQRWLYRLSADACSTARWM